MLVVEESWQQNQNGWNWSGILNFEVSQGGWGHTVASCVSYYCGWPCIRAK